MKKYKKSVAFTVALLCLLSVLLPSVVTAVTLTENFATENTTSSTNNTIPSNSREEALQVSEPELSHSESIEPPPEKETTKKIVDEDYDNREIQEYKSAKNSLQPTIELETKDLSKDFRIKGKLHSKAGEAAEKVTLTQVMLQIQTNNAEWEDAYSFGDTNDWSHCISEEPFSFDYSKSFEADDDYEFRLVLDYTIEIIEDSKVDYHKSHFPIGELKLEEPKTVERLIVEDSTDESESSDESTKDTAQESISSESTTAESSSEEHEESKSENQPYETEQSPEESSSSQQPNLFGSKNTIPEIPAIQTKGISLYEDVGGNSQTSFFKETTTKTSASISYSALLHDQGGDLDNDTGYVLYSKNSEAVRSARTGSTKSINDVELAVITNTTGINVKTSTLTTTYVNGSKCLKLSETLGNLDAGTTYYVWFVRKVTIPASGVMDAYETNTFFTLNGYAGNAESKYVPTPFKFKTVNPTPINSVSAPTLEELTPYSVKIKEGTYKGDIDQTPSSTGDVILNPGSNGAWEKYDTISHDHKLDGGKYYAKTINRLKPGTKYKVQVNLKDYFGNDNTGLNGGKSPETAFITPNTNGAPVLISNGFTNNDSPSHNTAEVKMTGYCQVYNNDNLNDSRNAYPNSLKVWLSEDKTQRSWQNISANSSNGSNPYVSFTKVGTSRVVEFKISKLSSNKKYLVCFQVGNIGGISPDPKNEESKITKITTESVPLYIYKPEFDQENAKISSIKMKNTPSFNGDIALDTSNKPILGEVYVGHEFGVNNLNKNSSDLPVSLNDPSLTSGKYNTGTVNQHPIDGLTKGTKYKSIVKLKRADGIWDQSEQNNFVTPNTIDDLAVPSQSDRVAPTSMYNAEVNFSGEYHVCFDHLSTNSNNAHPVRKVDVRLTSQDPGGNFSSVPWSNIRSTDTDSTISNVNVDTGNRKVSFKLSGLTANQRYWIRYRVRTEDKVWSEYSNGATSFQTDPIQIEMSEPKFTISETNKTEAKMKKGTFKGDASSDNNGRLFIIPNGEREAGENTLWRQVFTDLDYSSGRCGFGGAPIGDYNVAERTFGELKPGTNYKGRVYLNTIGNFRTYSNDGYFTTPNSFEPAPLSMTTHSTGINWATVSIKHKYNVYDNDVSAGERTPHASPTDQQIQVKLASAPDSEYRDASTRDIQIDRRNRELNFTATQLLENTEYSIRYRVKNAGGWSDYYEISPVMTGSRTSGLYINSNSLFDFGTLSVENVNRGNPLVQTSPPNNYIEMENLNVNSNWKVSAKLSELTNQETHSSLENAKITFNRQLQKFDTNQSRFVDYNDTSIFNEVGTTRPVEIIAGSDASVDLWSTKDIEGGKGLFRTVIPSDSVQLWFTGGGRRGKTFSGEITWLMDAVLE